jgi:hypothetical protein
MPAATRRSVAQGNADAPLDPADPRNAIIPPKRTLRINPTVATTDAAEPGDLLSPPPRPKPRRKRRTPEEKQADSNSNGE